MWTTVIGVLLIIGIGLSIKPYFRWEDRQHQRWVDEITSHQRLDERGDSL